MTNGLVGAGYKRECQSLRFPRPYTFMASLQWAFVI